MDHVGPLDPGSGGTDSGGTDSGGTDGGGTDGDSSGTQVSAHPGAVRRPTLNSSVRRRRADRAFFLRLAAIMRQNERALERLKR